MRAALLVLLVACGGKKDEPPPATATATAPAPAPAAPAPASDPQVVFRDPSGRVLTEAELANATGSVSWEVIGGDNVPAAAAALHEQGRAAGSSGKYAEAIAAFEKAAAAAPSWPYPLYDLGYTYELMDQPAKALAAYERVLALAPRGYFTVQVAVGCLRHERAGDWAAGLCKRYAMTEFLAGEERTKELTAIVAAAPQMAAPQKDLAMEIDDDARKVAAFDKVLALSPDPETRGVVLSNKAVALARMGKRDEAKQILGSLALDPSSPLDVAELAKFSLRQFAAR